MSKTKKRCGDCVYWYNHATGWCDYYSWPMDEDDDEPCRVYTPRSNNIEKNELK